jgi:hypothetical protein
MRCHRLGFGGGGGGGTGLSGTTFGGSPAGGCGFGGCGGNGLSGNTFGGCGCGGFWSFGEGFGGSTTGGLTGCGAGLTGCGAGLTGFGRSQLRDGCGRMSAMTQFVASKPTPAIVNRLRLVNIFIFFMELPLFRHDRPEVSGSIMTKSSAHISLNKDTAAAD